MQVCGPICKDNFEYDFATKDCECKAPFELSKNGKVGITVYSYIEVR